MSQRLARGVLTAIVFRQGCSYRQRLEAQFSARGWLPFRRDAYVGATQRAFDDMLDGIAEPIGSLPSAAVAMGLAK